MRDCEKIQELFTDALDGTLDKSDASRLMSHLEGCPECRRLFDDMKFIMGETASLSKEVPEDLHERITDAVKWQARIDAMKKRNRRHGLVAAACAVLILAGAGIASITGAGRKSEDSAMAEEAVYYAAMGLDTKSLKEMPALTESAEAESDIPQSNLPETEIEADIRDKAELEKTASAQLTLADGKTAYVISSDDYGRLLAEGIIANPEPAAGASSESDGDILIIERN